jgi:ABC-type transporter Mla MlaB component
MDQITLSGRLGPASSFELDDQLGVLTSSLRPHVTVDLTDVDELHPSIVSVLIRHQRQARRQGGDVRVMAPVAPDALRTLDQIGLGLIGRLGSTVGNTVGSAARNPVGAPA